MGAVKVIRSRGVPALKAAGTHLLISLIVASGVAALIFALWFKYPFDKVSGGRELFLLIVSIDAVIGPLLTLIVFDLRKPRLELWRDLVVIACLQLGALGYGVVTLAQARPVYLAFEGDRFRVAAWVDIDHGSLDEAAPEFRSLSWTGPRLIGVRLAQNTDKDYPESIRSAMEGLHPAFRPSRWVTYESQRDQIGRAARAMSELRQRYPMQGDVMSELLVGYGKAEDRLGFLPLLSGKSSDWVVVVDRGDASVVGYLPLDGWF